MTYDYNPVLYGIAKHDVSIIIAGLPPNSAYVCATTLLTEVNCDNIQNATILYGIRDDIVWYLVLAY